ncbi:MAG: nitrile hydratase subunit beta [Candidatus Latescibacteria bacterium]|nr:nitrile hydratase subunit beta [Candidatus Latescibacterota bacterium]
MDGIHDMGGMHGFGPIDIETDEPAFHEAWEGRALGICRLTPVPVPGGMRNNIERIEAAEYLRSSYYEKWLLARIKGLVDAGAITQAEYDAKLAHYRARPDAALPVAEAAPKPDDGTRAWPQPGPAEPLEEGPRYAVGDRVRARQIHPEGHTRLPRYIRGKVGQVIRIYRPQALQDSERLGGREGPEPVYAVQFAGAEVWGETAEANSCVLLDMWESYLEQAEQGGR